MWRGGGGGKGGSGSGGGRKALGWNMSCAGVTLCVLLCCDVLAATAALASFLSGYGNRKYLLACEHVDRRALHNRPAPLTQRAAVRLETQSLWRNGLKYEPDSSRLPASDNSTYILFDLQRKLTHGDKLQSRAERYSIHMRPNGPTTAVMSMIVTARALPASSTTNQTAAAAE